MLSGMIATPGNSTYPAIKRVVAAKELKATEGNRATCSY